MDSDSKWAKLSFFFAAMLLTLTLAIPGWASDTKEPIKIAVIAQEAGPVKPMGDQVRAGCGLAAQEINKAGGILGGRMIELHEYDEGYSTEVVISSLKRAVSDGCVAFTGFVDAAQAFPSIEFAKKRGVPIIIGYSGVDRVRVPGYYDAFFSISYGTQADATWWKWLDRRGVKRLATVRFTGDYPKDGNKYLHLWADEFKNLKLVKEVWYQWGETDITSEVMKAVAAKPDHLHMDIFSGAQAYPVVKRLKELGYEGTYNLGITSFDDHVIVKEGGALVDGAMAYTGWWPDPEVPESLAFAAAFDTYAKEHALNIPATDFVQANYLGLKALAMALDAAGTDADLDKFVKAMRELDWVTPRGNQLEVLPGGEIKTNYEYILRAQGGKISILDKVKITRDTYEENRIIWQ